EASKHPDGMTGDIATERLANHTELAMPGVESLARCIVRPAARREIAAIESVTVAAFAEFRDRIPAAMFDPYIEELRRVAKRWEEAEVLGAEVGGRIAGTASFYADASREGLGLPAGWAGIRCLAVDPATRGRGVGRGLVETCIDKARKVGAPT